MSPRNSLLICLALVSAGAFVLFRQNGASALDYRSSWGAALEEARDSGKPILINFGGPW